MEKRGLDTQLLPDALVTETHRQVPKAVAAVQKLLYLVQRAFLARCHNTTDTEWYWDS